MSNKEYTIDFYLVKSIDEDNKIITFSHLLDKIIEKNDAIVDIKGFKRDIFGISQNKGNYSAQVRKLRDNDLPEVGKLGTESKPLELKQDQGIIERNCFLFDSSKDILIWQNNMHGCNANIFADIVSQITNSKVILLPIIKKEAYKSLLHKGRLKTKSLEVSIARPSNLDLYTSDDPISSKLLEMLEAVGSDSLNITLSTDVRRRDSKGFLSNFSLSSIPSLLGLQPKKAKIIVQDEENDIQYPVDLISDRIRATAFVEYENGKHIPASIIYEAMRQAYHNKKGDLNEIIANIS